MFARTDCSKYSLFCCAVIISLGLTLSQDVSLNSVTPIKSTTARITKTSTLKSINLNLVCPGSKGTEPLRRFPLFALPCDETEDCEILVGPGQLCCSLSGEQTFTANGKNKAKTMRCTKGVPKPKPEIKHQPFLGVKRECPHNSEPLAEIVGGDVIECTSDAQCGALRICCPDRAANSGETRNYCRAPAPSIDGLPFPNFAKEPLRNALGYLQCTSPPPPLLDLFPKPCKNTFDCFPNVCCHEKGGKRHCRPPKRSVLALIAGFSQRIGTTFRNRLIASQKPLEGLN